MASPRICSVEGCGKPHHAHGFCAVHAERFRRLGDPLAGGIFRGKNAGAACKIDGCTKASRKRGMCDGHYARWRRHGDPLAGEVRVYRAICTVPDCSKPHCAQGYCSAHLRRFNLYGDPLALKPRRIRPAVCTVDGCGRPANGNQDLCHAHYKRLWRYGTATAGGAFRAKAGEPLNWLIAHAVYDVDDCLIWPYARDPSGYGVLGTKPKSMAHRAMCIMKYGAPPSPHHEAAHSCGHGHLGCVNPKHLRWATRKENAADRVIHGTQPFGEEVPLAKLTRDAVHHIRALRGVLTQAEIAAIFGIHQATVSSIQLGKSWSWLHSTTVEQG